PSHKSTRLPYTTLFRSQVERAQKILHAPGKKRKGKNPNDPMRFVKATTVTDDGEIAEKTVYDLDREQIEKEAMYDGFYAVVTNLDRKSTRLNSSHVSIS